MILFRLQNRDPIIRCGDSQSRNKVIFVFAIVIHRIIGLTKVFVRLNDDTLVRN